MRYVCYVIYQCIFIHRKYWHGIKETCEDSLTKKVIMPRNLNVQKQDCDKNEYGDNNMWDISDSKTVLPRKTRVSLTIRHVPNTKKIKIML